MFQGNWTCSKCGKPITELPFEPRSTAGLTCRDCFAKGRDNQGGGNAQPQSERPKVEGNWTCSGCGNPITSLPFEPRDTSNLLCIDCYKKKKAG
jgi:CxxC-x17-CxxC domain-containing protein